MVLACASTPSFEEPQDNGPVFVGLSGARVELEPLPGPEPRLEPEQGRVVLAASAASLGKRPQDSGTIFRVHLRKEVLADKRLGAQVQKVPDLISGLLDNSLLVEHHSGRRFHVGGLGRQGEGSDVGVAVWLGERGRHGNRKNDESASKKRQFLVGATSFRRAEGGTGVVQQSSNRGGGRPSADAPSADFPKVTRGGRT